jgi:hypothetical protein
MEACPSGKQLGIIWRAQRATAVEVGNPVKAISYGMASQGSGGPAPSGPPGSLPNPCPAGTSRSARPGGRRQTGRGFRAGSRPNVVRMTHPLRVPAGSRFRVLRRLR